FQGRLASASKLPLARRPGPPRAALDLEGNAELHGPLHEWTAEADELIHPVLLALEDQLVVHREQHLGPVHGGQRILDADHGHLQDVSGTALNRRISCDALTMT